MGASASVYRREGTGGEGKLEVRMQKAEGRNYTRPVDESIILVAYGCIRENPQF